MEWLKQLWAKIKEWFVKGRDEDTAGEEDVVADPVVDPAVAPVEQPISVVDEDKLV